MLPKHNKKIGQLKGFRFPYPLGCASGLGCSRMVRLPSFSNASPAAKNTSATYKIKKNGVTMMAHRNRNAQYVFQTEVIQNLD